MTRAGPSAKCYKLCEAEHVRASATAEESALQQTRPFKMTEGIHLLWLLQRRHIEGAGVPPLIQYHLVRTLGASVKVALVFPCFAQLLWTTVYTSEAHDVG